MKSLRRRLKREARKEQASPQPLITEVDQLVIGIGTPMVTDECSGAYCRSVVRCIAYCLGEGLRVAHNIVSYSIPQIARQKLAMDAIEAGCTHLLMIDADMEFPPDLPIRLVRHRKAIVAANCMARRPPYYLTARRENGDEVMTGEHSTGIEKVARAGTGVMMIDCDVFRSTPLPWFDMPWNPRTASWVGEDFTFCDRARANGHEVYIDHDASKLISHVGQFAFGPLMRAGFVTAQQHAAAKED